MDDLQKFTESFKQNGYAVVEDFLSGAEADSLRSACHHIINEMNPAEHQITTFSTTDNESRDDYFLESGDKIRFFFEQEAVDSKGNLKTDKHQALNKIGHALHWLVPEFKKVTFSEKVKKHVKALGFVDPAVVQSMYIFKQPGIGGEVTPHQDSTFLHTRPLNIIGLWIALEDATLENGCLWFIPGSHGNGITRRFVRNKDPKGPKLKFEGSAAELRESDFKPVQVKKGSCIFIHGEVQHKSAKNTSAHSRHIYTFHVIERHNTEYSSENWLQETENVPFPSVYSN